MGIFSLISLGIPAAELVISRVSSHWDLLLCGHGFQSATPRPQGHFPVCFFNDILIIRSSEFLMKSVLLIFSFIDAFYALIKKYGLVLIF